MQLEKDKVAKVGRQPKDGSKNRDSKSVLACSNVNERYQDHKIDWKGNDKYIKGVGKFFSTGNGFVADIYLKLLE